MKAKKKLLWLALAATLAVCAVVGAVIVNAAEPDTGKNGYFNGSPAHVDETGNLYIDEINFPDENFRNYIKEHPGANFTYPNFDKDSDGLLSVSEAAAVTKMDLSLYFRYSSWDDGGTYISDISGIEFFTNLESLVCSRNPIGQIDVSMLKNLKELYVNDTGLTKIVLDNPELTYLNCSENPIEAIDLSKLPKLMSLYIGSTYLTELVLENPELTVLSCGGVVVSDDITTYGFRSSHCITTYVGEKFSKLDVSACTKLEKINVGYMIDDDIKLPVTDTLKEILFVSVPISEIDVSSYKNLVYLNLTDTYISKIDCSANTELVELDVTRIYSPGMQSFHGVESDYNGDGISEYGGRLSTLNVKGCSKLEELDCHDNTLASLDLSTNTALKRLYCAQNKLTELDIANCPNITSYHANFQICDTKLEITKTKDGKYALDLSSIVSDTSKIDGIMFNFRDTGLGNVVFDYDPETGILTFSPLQEDLTINYGYKVPGAEKFTGENFSVSLTNVSVKAYPNPPETEPPVTEPDPPVTETEPPVTETEPPVTETEPVVTELIDKDDDVTVQYPESDAAYYEDVKLVAELKKSDANDRVSYSIELIKNGTPIQPKSTITIKLPVPQGWDVSTIVVYYVDDNGNREKVPSSISSDGKYVVFTTDHLSIYELATESSTPAETTATPTETTAAPAETTSTPAETTAAPAETTAAPVETTAAPAETTAAPVETTAAPAVTTASSSTGSEAQPPETGDAAVSVSALIVTMVCACAAGTAVFVYSKKRR